MLVKYVNKSNYHNTLGLTSNKEYTATLCVIHSFSTDVYVINDFGKEQKYSSTLFDKGFQSMFEEALEYFGDNERECYYGIFVRDYY